MRPDGVSASDNVAPAFADELGAPLSRIGPYRIVRLLGRGGMGAVYLAEQDVPVRREVAIKVLSTGIESELFVARFEAERQALALMEHPNITSVFDAGVTDSGLPYFVMERVSGAPLTQYCDQHRLGVTQRLELFRQICHAVQHAHQKGIIHRDLKPSNVIVSDAGGAPVCKVIDFGIAKAMGAVDATRLTLTGVSLGTPAYMSPEQARGDVDVDTRSDVYSLGVTLYELLAGVLPFDSGSSFAMLMMTQHGDARAPSVRFAALSAEEQGRIATARRTDPATLRRELQEDLDWIVLKAIESDRELRYASASELDADLERHFADQPVSVGPPSGSYRARKFVRRHKLAVAFAATTAALLVGATITVSVQARRIAAARNTAQLRQGQAEDLIGFMLGDLRTRLTAVGQLGVLDEVAKKSMGYFAAVPEKDLSNEELFRRSQALSQLGQVRMSQGKLDSAMAVFQQSLALAEGLSRRDSSNGSWQLGLGASQFYVGYVHFRRNELDSAMAHFKAYLRITERLVALYPDSLAYRTEMGLANSNIGSTLEAMGDLPGARAAYERKNAVLEELVRRDSAKLDWRRDLGNGYNTLGVVQRKLGDLAAAERSHRLELATERAIAARDTANRTYRERVALAQSYLGELLMVEGKLSEAADPVTESRAAYAAVAAYDTANVDRQRALAIADRLAGVYALEAGDAVTARGPALASYTLLESLAKRAPTNAVLKFNVARSLTLLGNTELALGRAAEAEASQRRALEIVEPALEKKPTDLNTRVAVSDAQLALGDALASRGRRAEATVAWQRSLATIDSVARFRRLTDPLALQSAALLRLDRIDQARPIVAEVLNRGYRRPSWLATVRLKHAAPAP